MSDTFTVLKSMKFYNYFCTKLGCFEGFFDEVKNKNIPCPICGDADDVVCDFGEEECVLEK